MQRILQTQMLSHLQVDASLAQGGFLLNWDIMLSNMLQHI